MEHLFLSIDYNDPLWILTAFLFGLAGRYVGLPPLVGFLAAGFALNYLGAEGGDFLNAMADLGVTLLLFSIGLKLRVRELFRPEVWAVTLLHTLSVSLLLSLLLLSLSALDLPLFRELNLFSALLVSFALSFSSTVFVVKVLEERGDMMSLYGGLAIGVLVVQDLAAVVFLGISEAKMPSVWATMVILALVFGRPLLLRLLEYIGHGELLVLFGLVLALGGAALFEAVDMKADLGGLVFGALLASHPKSSELAKALFSIKELFLVGFFLSIGLAGMPNLAIIVAVLVLLLAVALKSALFFALFSGFRVRSRPATAASLALGNYSEFGLIVTAMAVSLGWLSADWLVMMAVLVASSFVISAAVNRQPDGFYLRFRERLRSFQRAQRLRGDEDIDLNGVEVMICGLGRVGTGAYEHLLKQEQRGVLGLDFDLQRVRQHCEQGRRSYQANVSSPDFWTRLDLQASSLQWIMLCTANARANAATARMARQRGFTGLISAAVKYPDEEPLLRACGVDAVFNIYAEAGAGLAQHGREIQRQDQAPLFDALP
jgi:glutathione-regulated potassium-efflux system ancillary protein KefC